MAFNGNNSRGGYQGRPQGSRPDRPQGFRQDRPQGSRPEWSAPTLPQGYLRDGYYSFEGNGKPVLRREFIVGYPEEIARKLDDREKNKSSQLRKFYDYCIRIRSMLERGMSFSEVEGEFCRLVAFADYAQKRNRVSPLFVDFIRKNVMAVHNEQDLNAFTKHFEAVIAYIKK